MKDLEKAKKRIFEILQIGNRPDTLSLIFDVLIVCVIILNIVVTFCQTFAQLNRYETLLHWIELVTIVIFTVEYLLRIWTAEYLYPQMGAVRAKLKFAVSFYGLVDLLTILPYFLPFFFPSGAVAFRMLRVVRILHLFRINAKYDAVHVITTVLKEKSNQLMSSICLVLIMMMASSLCMYSLEHEAQPEHFANAFSGIWWSVSTLLTVGYGDIYPVTVGGQIMAIVIAFLGVGMVAIPTGIISAGFVEYYTRIKNGTVTRLDADFVTLEITVGHSFDGLALEALSLPQGLYVAAVLRDREVLAPYEELELRVGDLLVLGSMSRKRIEANVEEMTLTKGHSWIGQQIGDLDISRRSYVIMLKRGNKNIPPREDIRIRENDTLLIYHR